MNTKQNKQHWDEVFTIKNEKEVSWFQTYPKTSIAFVEEFNLPLDANIIDIGGGESHFAEALIDKGYTNVYVLDISDKALERAKKRLGEKASKITWIVSDIVDFVPPVQFDFWHDRAAFHFLTSEDSIYRYVAIAEDAIKNGGKLVLGTFSENGPMKCSNLDIKRYNEASMSARFEVNFNRIRCFTEDHITPSNKVQNFLFCSFERR